MTELFNYFVLIIIILLLLFLLELRELDGDGLWSILWNATKVKAEQAHAGAR